MGRFKKLIAAVLGAAAFAAYGYLDDQVFTNVEIVQTVSAGVAAFLVWLTANGPVGSYWHYAKTIAYAATAGLATLLTVMPDGIEGREWLAVLIAAGTGAGVLTADNKPKTSTYVTTH